MATIDEKCTACEEAIGDGRERNVVYTCDCDDGHWCGKCFDKTPCGRGEHGEGCPTMIVCEPPLHPRRDGRAQEAATVGEPMSTRSPRRQLGRTMTPGHPLPSPEDIERAVIMLEMNVCDGGSVRDDEVATISTGGAIGDVARLFQRLHDASLALRSFQHGSAKAMADAIDETIADLTYEKE